MTMTYQIVLFSVTDRVTLRHARISLPTFAYSVKYVGMVEDIRKFITAIGTVPLI